MFHIRKILIKTNVDNYTHMHIAHLTLLITSNDERRVGNQIRNVNATLSVRYGPMACRSTFTLLKMGIM